MRNTPANSFNEGFAPRPGAAVPVRNEAVVPSASAGELGFAAALPVLDFAQAVLKQLGRPSTSEAAKSLLETAPEMGRRLSLLGGAAVPAAARHLLVNVPGVLPAGSGNVAADAKAYAQDLGYQDFKIENGHGVLTASSGPIDVGALSSGASLEEIGQAINETRFGTATVVPPPAFQPGKTFKIDNAHLATHLSRLAYNDEAEVKAQLAQWGYDTSTFSWIEDKTTDTQGFVVKDKQGNTFVTFRGTESARDAQTDADAHLTSVTWGGKTMQVHRGFATALDSVWPQVEAAMKKARGSATDDNVVFTGHSLGGALGTLAALRANLEGLAPDDPRTSNYAIASPRTGDDAFMNVYNQRLPQTYRVVNFASGTFVDSQDIVTQIPPKALGFRHVGNLVRLEDDRFTLKDRSDPVAAMALESLAMGPSHARTPAHDTRDAVNASIESLSGDELQRKLLEVAMENRERREPVHHAPRAAVAGGPQLESMVAMALPSVSFHKSGLYLERTGTAVMAE